jgi:hypothetical protein
MVLPGSWINVLWTLENFEDLRSTSSVQGMLLLGSLSDILWTLDPCGWVGGWAKGREGEGGE